MEAKENDEEVDTGQKRRTKVERNEAQQEQEVMTSEELLRYIARLRQQINILKPKLNIPETENESTKMNITVPPPLPHLEERRMFDRYTLLEIDDTVKEYGKIKEKTVAIVGLGRIGSQVATLLARSGVCRFILFDCGEVKLGSLESSAYLHDHIGMNKTQATRMNIFNINPSCAVLGEKLNVMDDHNFLALKRLLLLFGPESALPSGHSVLGATRRNSLRHKSDASMRKADLVISCLSGSSTEAKMRINDMCLEMDIPLFNVSLDSDSTQSAVNVVYPGKTACLECLVAKQEATEVSSNPYGRRKADDQTKGQEEKMDLPGLSLFLAGLVAQGALKKLLDFGVVFPSFKYRMGQDLVSAAMRIPSAKRGAPRTQQHVTSKEFQSFQVGPYERCPNARCQRKQKRESGPTFNSSHTENSDA